MTRLRSTCLLILTAAQVACAPMAVLKETRVRLIEISSKDARIKQAADALTDAVRHQKRDPKGAVDRCLRAARDATEVLKRRPGDEDALRVYNFALDSVFSILRKHHLDPWSQALDVGDFVLTQQSPPRSGLRAKDFDLIPVDALEAGNQLEKSEMREGIGSPLVAISKGENLRFRETFPLGPQSYLGITAVAHFSGSRCEIEFIDPLDVETVNVGGRRMPLAADYTASYAYLMEREQRVKVGLARLLNPGKHAQTARIVRLRPYDPERVPLLLVHGLLDTPSSWMPLLNALRDDPFIRKHYQVWAFTYPSGYPYPYSAALLRSELDKVAATFPGHKPIVYIGHSMGGTIGRLMLTDSGDKLWKKSFNEPPEKSRLPPQDLRLMRDLLIFRHREDISRAIFISTPHQGSKVATSFIGRMGRRLVKTPSFLAEQGYLLKHALTLDEAGFQMERIPCSIDTLSPDNPFVKAVNELPLATGIPYHSIMGDRGRRNTPESSDGFVPYWSSHLEGAVSELTVPSGHRAHRHPRGIQEVLRILHSHPVER